MACMWYLMKVHCIHSTIPRQTECERQITDLIAACVWLQREKKQRKETKTEMYSSTFCRCWFFFCFYKHFFPAILWLKSLSLNTSVLHYEKEREKTNAKRVIRLLVRSNECDFRRDTLFMCFHRIKNACRSRRVCHWKKFAKTQREMVTKTNSSEQQAERNAHEKVQSHEDGAE